MPSVNTFTELNRSSRSSERVTLEAQQRDDEVIIRIVDDGRGLDPQKLRAKAVEKGILAPNAKIEDRDALSLILEPDRIPMRSEQNSLRGVRKP